MRHRAVVVGFVAFTLASCGGNDTSPVAQPTGTTLPTTTLPTTTAPASSTTTTQAATTTTAAPRFPGEERAVAVDGSPITMYYDAGVPSAELSLITASLQWARDDHGDSGPLRVFVYSNPTDFLAAYALGGCGRNEVERYLSTFSGQACRGTIWQYRPDPPNRRPPTQQSVSHEYFHTVQEAKRQPRLANELPVWLAEGTANYFSWMALDNRAFVSSRTVPVGEFLRVNYQQSVEQTRQAPALQSMERTSLVTGSDQAAALGLVASRYLVDRFGEEKLRSGYWKQLSMEKDDWKKAFPGVFGMSVEQFYADFELHRRTL
jgi:hypothetical protein